MNRKLLTWSHRYRAALQTHLKQSGPASLESVRGMGSKALDSGLQMLDLAKLREQILISELLPGCPPRKRAALIKQAGRFFAAVVSLPGKTLRSTSEEASHLQESVEMWCQRTVKLAACNRELRQKITRHEAVEEALKKKERHYSQVLKQSEQLQEQLRQLSRQILSAQENERKEISRELHDLVAQTLMGINIRLATLKTEAALDSTGLNRSIAQT